LDELAAIKSCHLVKLSKCTTKRDALYHEGILNIITYSIFAVNRKRLKSVVFGVYHVFTGWKQLRRELEAREMRANGQRAWCVGHGYWTLAEEHAGEALACETLVRMIGG